MLEEITGFPSDFVSRDEKGSNKYGLMYAKSIYSNYLGKNTQFSSIQRRYQENRKYAEGLQSIEKFKSFMGMDDTVYAAMDWSAISVIPVFVDLMVGEMINQDFKLVASAVDQLSSTEKDKEKARLVTNMKLKDFAEYIEENTGFSPIKKEDVVPGSIDEIEIHMQMNFKLSREIAIEEFLKFIFIQNKDKELKRKVYRDLVVLKKGIAKICINEHDDIEIRYVDPVNFISSYSVKDDYSDVRFAGEVVLMDITELRRQAKGDLNEEALFKIASQYSGKNGNPEWRYGSDYQSYYSQYGQNYYGFDNFLIPVLDFQFLSTEYKTYSEKPNKYGGIYFDEVKPGKQKESESKVYYDKEIDFKYGGCWVVNTDYIYGYGLKYDNLRKKSNGVYSGETELDYVVFSPNHYEMENKSIVERMIPHADAIQRASLKLQHLIMKMKPSGIAVDVGSLHDIFLGKMVESDALEVQEFYEQTGVYYYNSKDEDGIYANRPPIQEIKQNIGAGLQEFIHIFEFERQKLRDISGVNEARDGISMKEDVAFKTQQMSLQASRNATEELNSGLINIYERLASKATSMIQYLIKHNRFDKFKNIIGQLSVDILKMKDTFSNAEFGIYLQALPDETEKQLVEQNIQQALQQQLIKLSDAIRVRELMKTSTKQANQFLVLRQTKYLEEEMMKSQQMQEQNVQLQQQSNEQAQQYKMQEKELELKILQLKYQLEDSNNQSQHLRKMEEIKLQGNIKSTHIEQAADEDFKKTALTESIKQPRVFDSQTGSNA